LRGGILKKYFSCTQERWETKAGDKPKETNKFVPHQHFKIEGFHCLKDMLQKIAKGFRQKANGLPFRINGHKVGNFDIFKGFHNQIFSHTDNKTALSYLLKMGGTASVGTTQLFKEQSPKVDSYCTSLAEPN